MAESILKKFFNRMTGVKIDDEFYDELEETLIMSDVGVKTSESIIEELREEASKEKIKTPEALKEFLVKKLKQHMELEEDAFAAENGKSVYMLIGVNGVGKTTTCAKLAGKFKADGKKVLLVAADTFRAAAIEQLLKWSERIDCDIVCGNEGADPGAAVFDACAAAKARNVDTIICDTAGRLHNKKNLMAELKKLYGIISAEYPQAKRETLIVLDASTGQNAIEQAKQFSETADVTGIVLTKLDGTAKGGAAVAIQSELRIPVKYIGTGEGIEDIKKFDADEYIRSLFDNA